MFLRHVCLLDSGAARRDSCLTCPSSLIPEASQTVRATNIACTYAVPAAMAMTNKPRLSAQPIRRHATNGWRFLLRPARLVHSSNTSRAEMREVIRKSSDRSEEHTSELQSL